VPPNPTNAAHLRLRNTANAANSLKRAGVVVRDEEVVGSNPATPTAKSLVRWPQSAGLGLHASQ
jgi:hypothetical protein